MPFSVSWSATNIAPRVRLPKDVLDVPPTSKFREVLRVALSRDLDQQIEFPPYSTVLPVPKVASYRNLDRLLELEVLLYLSIPMLNWTVIIIIFCESWQSQVISVVRASLGRQRAAGLQAEEF